MQQIIDSYAHKEYIDTHTKNIGKQDIYKCNKEQIQTRIKNTFIHIHKIQLNKTCTNVATNRLIHTKNSFTHIQRIQLNKRHINVAKNRFSHKEYFHTHTKNTI